MKYEKLFSVMDTNAYLTDFSVKSGYGNLPGIFVIQNNFWQFYVPENGFSRWAKQGYKNCFNAAFLPNYKIKVKLAFDLLFEVLAEKKSLQNYDAKQLEQSLNRFAKAIVNFLKLYLKTEFIYFAGLESELNSWAKKEFGQKFLAVISDLLQGKKSLNLPTNIKK